jgi:hypothetical protein
MAENLVDKSSMTVTEPKVSAVASIMDKIKDNKLYVGIGLFIVVLGYVLYYYFIKNKNDTLSKLGFLNKFKSKPVQNPNEYIILDANGVPVKVNNNLQPQQVQEQQMMLAQQQQQMMLQQQQQMQQQMLQDQQIQQMKNQKAQRMQQVENEIPNELEEYDLNQIEDPSVSMQNLTNSELANIDQELSN